MSLIILAKNNKSSAVKLDLETKFMDYNPSEPVNIIRWGVTKTHRNFNEFFQPREGIILAADKLECRKTLLKENIPCPKIIDINNPTFPLIARKKKHRMGRQFYFVENASQLTRAIRRKADYLQEFIDKDKEYRVHVFLNKVLIVQEKVGENKTVKNWNHSSGFVFEVIPWSKIPKGLCEIAVKAIGVIGLHFGAVDIIQKDNDFYVLEINTAPGIDGGYTLERYNLMFNYVATCDSISPLVFNKKYLIRKEELIGD